jgi:hypothetical protein
MSSQALAAAALTISVLTSILLGGVFPAFFAARLSASEDRTVPLTELLNATNAALLLTQATYIDALMDVDALTPNITITRSGTYTMRCAIYFDLVTGPSTTATWHLETVLLGSALNFTVLVLDTPTTPCTWTTFGAVQYYSLVASEFGPDLFSPFGVLFSDRYITLSAPNQALIETTTNCFALAECSLQNIFSTLTYTTPSAVLRISIEFLAPAAPGVEASPYFKDSLRIILPLL